MILGSGIAFAVGSPCNCKSVLPKAREIHDRLDISMITESATYDPLVAVLGVLILVGIATSFLFRKRPVGRAIVRVVFLISLTIVFFRADLVPYQPLQLTGNPFLDVVHGVLKIAWWLWAAWFLVGLLRAVVTVERRPRESKLLQDLLAGFIYLIAIFAIISYVFDKSIEGLLATSGAVAIILGLALQSSLGDVFSGIVLSFSRPYLPGDWINIDGGTEGRVIEMNWRATHILTGRRDLAIVPNSSIAKSKIVNVSSPSGIHGITVTVQVDPKAPPSTGVDILKKAILNCRLIVREPSPTVIVKSITAGYTEFEITFFVEQLASSTSAQNQLFDLICRHLAVGGIGLAWPQNQPDPGRQDEKPRLAMSAIETQLELVDIFASLTARERSAIAAKLKPASHGEGDTLLEVGTVLKSLLIVGAGVLSVTRVDEIAGEIEMERLGPGDHYGEIGMLTGTPSIAKITALTPATVYQLKEEDLAPILEAHPQVAHELGGALARRQATHRLTAPTELGDSVPTNRLTAWFSEQLHRLHDLSNAG
jgi:small-conductance mechanosensitive channel/CRP-like cAMP-binding protein